MKLYAPHAYDADALSFETGLSCEEPTLAQQHFLDEVDINEIVRRFGLTGELPNAVRAPTYGDFTGVFDYQSAMNAIRSAEESFMEMPAEVRARFNNDPQAFVEFCSDAGNSDEARKLGLLVERQESSANSQGEGVDPSGGEA